MMEIKKGTLTVLLMMAVSFSAVAQSSPIRDKQIYKLYVAAQSILFNYVDTVDKETLVEDAISGMLKDLDPHSSYLTAEQVKKANEPLVGNYKGVGIEFNILKDTLLVVAVIEGGPSEKAGLRPGDRILTVNGDTIAGIGLKNEDVIRQLKGEEGSVVKLDILRRGYLALLPYEITRGTIPILSIDAAFIASEDIGYIKINRFSASTHEEFVDAVKALKKQGMKKLILDLQGNGGGYLSAAIKMADEFLNEDKLLVYTQSRHERNDNVAHHKGIFEKKELVILIDESSASASEILAGAVQDWDRGLIIGRRSFGKGLVQRPFRLPDKSEMRLTISRYYTPCGRSIQRSYKNGKGEYRSDLSRRIEHGELFNEDSIAFPDSLMYKTLVYGRKVYGGGGIMPDIFVPLDTMHNSKFFKDINRLRVLDRFTLDYVDKNREQLSSIYSNFSSFDQGFAVNEDMFNNLVKEAKREDIEYNDSALVSKDIILLQMKAYVARYLFEREMYYQVMKSEDMAYMKAIELLGNETVFYQRLQQGH